MEALVIVNHRRIISVRNANPNSILGIANPVVNSVLKNFIEKSKKIVSKYAPKRLNKLIPRSQIKETLVLIQGTDDYYITPSAKVYRQYPTGYLLRQNYKNKRNNYLYITLSINGKRQTYRLHRLVAQAYLPNPNNYPIVGHKDNIKQHCDVSNLYWTTNAENIQKAVNDGLLKNDKGYNDSQSYPVICYDSNMIEIARFGSVSECSRAMHVSKSTVLRHCNYEIKTTTRTGYYFRFQDT